LNRDIDRTLAIVHQLAQGKRLTLPDGLVLAMGEDMSIGFLLMNPNGTETVGGLSTMDLAQLNVVLARHSVGMPISWMDRDWVPGWDRDVIHFRRTAFEGPKTQVGKASFDDWMRQVDKILDELCSMESADFQDYAYRNAYDDGMTPRRTAHAALQNAKES